MGALTFVLARIKGLGVGCPPCQMFIGAVQWFSAVMVWDGFAPACMLHMLDL